MPEMVLHLVMLGLISSGFLAVFLAIVFLRQRRNNRRTHLLMGLLLLTLAASAAVNAYFSIILPRRFPRLTTLPDPFLLLIGPLFFEYIVRLSGGRRSWFRNLVHILPFAAVSWYLINLFSSADADPDFHVIAWILLGIYLHYWLYYFLNRRQLANYRHRLKGLHSSMERVYQAWIAFCLRTLLVVYSILGVLFLLQHGQIFLPINRLLAILLAVMIYFIAYHILTRPALFGQALIAVDPTDAATSMETRGKPAGSNEAETKSAEAVAAPESEGKGAGPIDTALRDKLLNLMEQKKPYTDPELDLSMLAARIRLTTHQLSQLINADLASNFYDFVNGYRVEEAKRLLADPANDQFTVIALAYDAGFNSKATFNRMFKKKTGLTPSQFRRAAHKS